MSQQVQQARPAVARWGEAVPWRKTATADRSRPRSRVTAAVGPPPPGRCRSFAGRLDAFDGRVAAVPGRLPRPDDESVSRESTW